MTFTYDEADISTDLAKVRTILGDTDSADPLLSDEQINYYLSVQANVFAASSMAAQAIQAKYSRLADTSVESVSVKYSQKAAAYAKLSEDMNRRSLESASNIPLPSVLGVSKDAIDTQRADSDRVQSKFYMDKFSNPPEADSDDED